MNINYGIMNTYEEQLTLFGASFSLDFEFYHYCSYGGLLSLFLLVRFKIFRISAEL